MSYTLQTEPPRGVATPQLPALDPDILNGTVTDLEDGGAEIAPVTPMQVLGPDDVPHAGNLAEVLPDQVLGDIAADLLEGIDADVESNSEWYRQVSEGMALLGLDPGERKSGKLKDIPAARHPLLKEAALRFVATASGELLPAAGPVRCQVFGDSTPERQQQADRKADYLNYRLTVEDEDYYPDCEQMILLVSLYGSMFRKVWNDPLRGGEATSRHFSPFDIVVSYGATTLAGPWRVTHIEPMQRSDVKRLQLQAWYRDVDLSEPSGDEGTPAREQDAAVDFRRPTDRPQDADHVLYHCHCLLDIEGAEHRGEDGEPSGLPLPYVVTIDRDSRKVLRIERNWDEADPSQRPRERYVHFQFMPSPGFLGWGLIHLVGADAAALTSLRQMALVNFAFASFPGGLRSESIKGDTSDLTVGPGEWAPVNTAGQPIGNMLMPLPYKDVPPSYQALTADVLTAAQRVAATSDIATGDMREDALPGTVIALIQRAAVLESGAVKRLHRAQRKELRMLADLIGKDPRETYPYQLNGRVGQATTPDFADNSDVVPVSDPNVPTRTERLSMAQATMTIAQQGGGNVRASAIAMLQTMGKSDAEIANLFPPPPAAQPMDPVSEFAAAMQGAPLKAGSAQDHQAHIQAHMTQMVAPNVNGTPVGAALQAHIADHTAQFYAATLAGMGIQVMPGQPLPPQAEQQISAAVAAASDAVRQKLAQLVPQPQGDPLAAQKLQLQAAQLQASQTDSQRKAIATSEQNQVEMARAQLDAQNDAAERESRLQQAQIDLEKERVRAGAVTTSAMAQHVAGPLLSGMNNHHAAPKAGKQETQP